MTLRDEISACKRCHLRKTCTQPVPGYGPLDAKAMIVGEAPGANEDLECQPFIGPAGSQLNEMLKAAGLNRADFYITNVVKCMCRDGERNRVPTEAEMAFCKQWLWKEIQLVKPTVIFTLGKIPTYTLLNKQLKKNFKLGDILGKHHKVDYTEAIIVPNYHPSFIMQHGRKYVDDAVSVFKKASIECHLPKVSRQVKEEKTL